MWVNLGTLQRNPEEKFVNAWTAVVGFPHLLLNPLKRREKKDLSSLFMEKKLGYNFNFAQHKKPNELVTQI